MIYEKNGIILSSGKKLTEAFVEGFVDGGIVFAAQLGKFLEFAALLGVELCWDFDFHANVEIAALGGLKDGHSLSFYAEDGASLSSSGDFKVYQAC